MTDYYLPCILLVEDDIDDIDLFKEALILVSPKSKLFTAQSCNEALNYLLKEGNVIPDVIFMDLGMSIINGFECIRLIKSHEAFKEIAIVVLSTSITPPHLDALYELGVKYFITKPATFSKLQDAINKVVNTPEIFTLSSKETFYMQDFA